MKRNSVFWVVTATIFLGLLVPFLFQDGMSLDGVTYSAISRNMAMGIGSLWSPHYTQTLYPDFHEHPALFFIIESFFFRFLGDSIYTERIFTFLTAIITAIGLVLCWNLFAKKSEYKSFSWVAVFLWITIPVVFWSYRSNMIENVLGIFTLFSVYFVSKSLLFNKPIFLLLGGLLIVLAFLSKGPVGLFPLAAPLLYWIAFRNVKVFKPLMYSVVLGLVIIFVYVSLITFFPEIEQNVIGYLNQQLFPALENKREITVGNRFSIIFKLFTEVVFPLILVFYVLIYKKIRGEKMELSLNRESLYFFLLALSASLPLIVTLKQRRFYLVPSLALFAIAAGLFVVPYLSLLIEQISVRKLKWINASSLMVLLFVFVFSFVRFGKFSRDQELLEDVYKISASIPEGTVIATTKNTWADWTLSAYLIRNGRISLDCDHAREYYLLKNSEVSEVQLLDYLQPIDLGLKNFTVYKKH